MNSKILKKPLLWLVLVALVFGFWLWRTGYISYRTAMAWKKARISWSSVEVAKVLLRPDLPDTLRKGLATTKSILDYAHDSLGLDYGSAFGSLYENPAPEQAFLLTASPNYQLKAIKYGWIMLDSLSYIVFFNKNIALGREKKLILRGFDTRIDPIAFSQISGSLLTPALFNRSQVGLAGVIFYKIIEIELEKNHYKGPLKSMAVFLSEKATLQYMHSISGQNSNSYLNFYNNLQDYQQYGIHILHGAAQLDSLYKTFNERTTPVVKQDLKEKYIARIISRLDTVPFHFPEIYLNHFAEIGMPNNTYFLSYISCRQNHEIFEKEFNQKYNNNLKKYLSSFKTTK